MTMKLSQNAKLELGTLMVNTDELTDLLTLLPKERLAQYPQLQKELFSKHPKVKAYNKAIKDKRFSKEEYLDRIFARLDIFAYELAIEMNNDFLIDRVRLIVGDDIDQIDELSIPDIGADVIGRILSGMANQVNKQFSPKTEHPFLAERGRIDHSFWRHADKAYLAFEEGYVTQAALDAWCQLNLNTRCPQSFIRWLKTHGDPRELNSWLQYAK